MWTIINYHSIQLSQTIPKFSTKTTVASQYLFLTCLFRAWIYSKNVNKIKKNIIEKLWLCVFWVFVFFILFWFILFILWHIFLYVKVVHQFFHLSNNILFFINNYPFYCIWIQVIWNVLNSCYIVIVLL